jgi:hypothetical protein
MLKVALAIFAVAHISVFSVSELAYNESVGLDKTVELSILETTAMWYVGPGFDCQRPGVGYVQDFKDAFSMGI